MMNCWLYVPTIESIHFVSKQWPIWTAYPNTTLLDYPFHGDLTPSSVWSSVLGSRPFDLARFHPSRDSSIGAHIRPTYISSFFFFLFMQASCAPCCSKSFFRFCPCAHLSYVLLCYFSSSSSSSLCLYNFFDPLPLLNQFAFSLIFVSPISSAITLLSYLLSYSSFPWLCNYSICVWKCWGPWLRSTSSAQMYKECRRIMGIVCGRPKSGSGHITSCWTWTLIWLWVPYWCS